MNTKGLRSTRWPESQPSATFRTGPPIVAKVKVDKPSTCHRSPPSHVGSVKAVRRIAIRVTILATHVVAGLLRGIHLSLQGRSVGIDPLELLEVAVEDANNLAEL